MALIGPGGRPVTAAKPAAAGPASPHIKDSGLATFAADVLEASREVPVIVDFWAPWCGPCKQLGPVLERIVAAANGAVKLVKVNIDENQEIARQLRIQSIPAVIAFKNGQPVDGFMGAIPESQVRDFVTALAGEGHGGHDHAEEMLAVADEAFAAGDVGQAAQAYAHVLQDEPGHPKAVAGLARCYLKSGDLERAKQTLQLVRPDGAGDEAVRAVEAELKLREQSAGQADKMSELLAILQAEPNNHQARFDLALALDAKGDREAAMDTLLDIVRRDRKWNEDAARKHLMTLFEAMGPTDPRTIEARRKLSSILFSCGCHGRALSYDRRPAPHAGRVSADRRAAPAARASAAQCLRAALSGAGRVGAVGQPADRNDPADRARGQGAQAGADRDRLRRAHHRLSRDRGRALSHHADRHLPLPRRRGAGYGGIVPCRAAGLRTLRGRSRRARRIRFSARAAARGAQRISRAPGAQGRLEERDECAGGDAGQRARHALPVRTEREAGPARGARMARPRAHASGAARNGRHQFRLEHGQLRRWTPIPSCWRSWSAP